MEGLYDRENGYLVAVAVQMAGAFRFNGADYPGGSWVLMDPPDAVTIGRRQVVPDAEMQALLRHYGRAAIERTIRQAAAMGSLAQVPASQRQAGAWMRRVRAAQATPAPGGSATSASTPADPRS